MAHKPSTRPGSMVSSSSSARRREFHDGRRWATSPKTSGAEVDAKRRRPDSVGDCRFWIAGFVALLSMAACTGSDASSTTATTLQIAPPTAAKETATASSNTDLTSSLPPTTTVAPTAAATIAPTTAPPSTTVQDQLILAIERAQTAIRNCDKAVPQPCNRAELDEALVGDQLDYYLEQSRNGIISIEGENELTWTLKGDPVLESPDLAVAVVCRFDPMVVGYGDGRVDANAYYFLQDWYFLPVGNTWKLSEVVNRNDATTDPGACDT